MGRPTYRSVALRDTSLRMTGFNGLLIYYSGGMRLGKNESFTCLILSFIRVNRIRPVGKADATFTFSRQLGYTIPTFLGSHTLLETHA
jgi:hypothetical protein